MKLFLTVITFGAAVSFTACAQKIDASKVPAAVKESFAKQFPGVQPKWEKEEGKYEAGFEQQGQEVSVLFEADGMLVETETEIKVAELPPAGTAYIKKNYGGASIKEAAKIIMPGGEVNYEAAIKKTDLIFDANGAFLKEIKH